MRLDIILFALAVPLVTVCCADGVDPDPWTFGDNPDDKESGTSDRDGAQPGNPGATGGAFPTGCRSEYRDGSFSKHFIALTANADDAEVCLSLFFRPLDEYAEPEYEEVENASRDWRLNEISAAAVECSAFEPQRHGEVEADHAEGRVAIGQSTVEADLTARFRSSRATSQGLPSSVDLDTGTVTTTDCLK